MLSVKNLDLFYGDAQALSGVSLEVPDGEIVAIVGANGAGKSSLIRAIAGIEQPRSGSILYKEREILGLESHAICDLGIGQVAEGRQVFPSLTVLENLQMGGLLPRARKTAGRTLEEVLAMFPRLRERATQSAGTLSGGEQQMLAIGRALMTNPRLLILDEATEGLAPLVRAEIYRSIERLKSAGLSILVIDKDLKALTRIADRHYVLEKGRVVWEGPSSALAANQDVQHRYLGI
jgi:branched-chain amino acid transport system ATP-binding protein